MAGTTTVADLGGRDAKIADFARNAASTALLQQIPNVEVFLANKDQAGVRALELLAQSTGFDTRRYARGADAAVAALRSPTFARQLQRVEKVDLKGANIFKKDGTLTQAAKDYFRTRFEGLKGFTNRDKKLFAAEELVVPAVPSRTDLSALRVPRGTAAGRTSGKVEDYIETEDSRGRPLTFNDGREVKLLGRGGENFIVEDYNPGLSTQDQLKIYALENFAHSKNAKNIERSIFTAISKTFPDHTVVFQQDYDEGRGRTLIAHGNKLYPANPDYRPDISGDLVNALDGLIDGRESKVHFNRAVAKFTNHFSKDGNTWNTIKDLLAESTVGSIAGTAALAAGAIVVGVTSMPVLTTVAVAAVAGVIVGAIVRYGARWMGHNTGYNVDKPSGYESVSAWDALGAMGGGLLASLRGIPKFAKRVAQGSFLGAGVYSVYKRIFGSDEEDTKPIPSG